MHTKNRIRKTMSAMEIQLDGLTDETSLKGDLDIDSTEHVELVVSLEEEFGLSLGSEAEKIATYGELCTYIAAQLESDAKEDANATS